MLYKKEIEDMKVQEVANMNEYKKITGDEMLRMNKEIQQLRKVEQELLKVK